MKVSDYPRFVLEAWAVWEALRCLGFEADDIYFLVAPSAIDGREWAHIRLKPKAGGEFTAAVMPIGGSRSLAMTLWVRFGEQLNRGELDHDELKGIYRRSPAVSMEFVSALYDAGCNSPEVERCQKNKQS